MSSLARIQCKTCSIAELRVRPSHGRYHASGQAMIIFALFVFVLVGFMALSMDGGFVLAERRQLQNAADAAALAAAHTIMEEGTIDDAVDAAEAYALANAGAGATVDVFRPPRDGRYVGDNQYVQVVVEQDVRQFFVGALYDGPWRITSSAVAGIEPQGADYALLTLNRNGTNPPGIYLNGNTGIVVTGDNASAMSNTNIYSNGVPRFTTTGFIDAASTIATSHGTWNPPGRVRQNQPVVDDPLSWMAVPAKGTSRTFAANCPGRVCQPGWYRNQNITMSGTWTLSPGVYYFENTRIDLQNTNATIQGTGVYLYFDSTSTFDPKNGNVNLTSSSTPAFVGAQEGMVFWYAGCGTLDMQGNADLYFSGIFYAPCAHVQMRGTPAQDTIHGQIFVHTFEVRGTADLRISYVSWADTTRPKVYLVE